MKNKKRVLYLLAAAMFMLSAGGCSLAVSDAGTEEGDHMIGAFITAEPLDLYDTDRYMKDHAADLKEEETIEPEEMDNAYEQKLYADIDKSGGKDPEDWEISFGNISGMRFLAPVWMGEDGEKYRGSLKDQGICDVSVHIGTTDATDTKDTTEECTLKGTVYMLQGQADIDVAYYVNPVFQQTDGDIYVMSGEGFSTSKEGAEGEQISTTLEDSTVINEGRKEKTEKFSVTVSLATQHKPVKNTLYQMDQNHKILKEESYRPGEMPEKISAQEQTEYILAEAEKETLSGEKILSRKIYEKDSETGSMAETFYALDNGMLTKQETEIIWR